MGKGALNDAATASRLHGTFDRQRQHAQLKAIVEKHAKKQLNSGSFCSQTSCRSAHVKVLQ